MPHKIYHQNYLTLNMETWFVIIVTACLATLLKAFLSLKSNKSKWPPGPRVVPIIGPILWLTKSGLETEAALRSLRSKFGSIVTFPIGSLPIIYVSNGSLAHEALVQKGAIFADRPRAPPIARLISSNQHRITSAGYGPTWRILRRNLTSQILHPSRVKDFSHARKWVLEILLTRLRGSSASPKAVKVMEHLRFTMFSLLVFMCFGEKLDESQIKEIEDVQHRLLVSSLRYQALNLWPRLSKIIFRSYWDEIFNSIKRREEVLMPLIRPRMCGEEDRGVTSYVDTLLKLELEEDGTTKRKLTEPELVSVCSEFLDAGTDTTSTALQWIMANLVKYPEIQAKLFEEIKGVVGPQAEEIREDELSKMPYLKAIILEGLRRHPPGHFVLPHAVTQEVELGGYTVPKHAIINFVIGEMGWDPEVWEDPMQFKPERFLSPTNEVFDITGSREIKMAPFGAGRRICPAYDLAMLHLEYFVANLVWNFEWAAVDGEEVDLSEKQEFTIVMKHPLQARISPRPLK